MDLPLPLIWIVAGGALMGIEALFIPGIGLVFAGLGAITVGAGLMAGLYESYTYQFAVWFISTALWAIVLWKPLKKFQSPPGSGYNDMIGGVASAGPDGLEKGKIGQVKWSGTIMNARLAPDCAIEKFEPDMEVKIVDVKNGVLIVTSK